MLALLFGLIQLLLAFSPLPTMSWALLAEGFFVGVLVLYKRSFAKDRLNTSAERPLRLFLRSFFLYAMPAGVLWSLFAVNIFRHYLPRVGLVLVPSFAAMLVTLGVLALCDALVGDEFARLKRPSR